ncbi:MAG: exo-alpha-sialidase [Patescibacteria group bacterium]
MNEEEIRPEADLLVPSKKPVWLFVVIGLIIIVGVGILTYSLGKAKPAKNSDDSIIKTENETKDLPAATSVDDSPYNWSTMDQGPYNDKISYATSTDLLNWKDSGKILATHASVPDLVMKDGTIFAYFVDVSTDGVAEQTGMVKSTDGGITWSERQIINIEGIGDKAVADPAPILLSDGRIRLFYFDIKENRIRKQKGPSTNKIYSAISSDGVNFTQEDGVRFEYEMVFDPDVIKISDNLWRMYVGDGEGQKVLSATSTDGLTFTYEGIAFSGGAIPNVIFENNRYYLFTVGIEISTSPDGKIFTKAPNRFDSGKLTADPGVIKIAEGKYLMVYKTSEMKPKI